MDSPIAYFHEADQARAVVARLVAGGFEAGLSRGRLAGEDDDEDQPWQVSTDAPDMFVDLLVEEYDGWLDYPAPAPAPPLVLPSAPKRHHRPPGAGPGAES